MKKILFIVILLNVSFNLYSADIVNSNSGYSKAQDILNYPNSRNSSNYNTNDLNNKISNWLDNADSNLNAVMGDKSKKLSTVGTNDKIDINMSCVVSQIKLAELNISDGTDVTMILRVLRPAQDIQVDHINGVCINKFTVCNEEENKKLCNMSFKYTNYGNENKSIDNVSNIEKEIIKSNPCYKVSKCMSWSYVLDNGNIIFKNTAGSNCNAFQTTGITISEKDALINQIKTLLSELSTNGLSDTISGHLNNKTEYYELSNNCNNNSYGSGNTNIKDLTDIYNNPISEKDKNKIVEQEKNNQNSILSKLDNSSNSNSYTLDRDIMNNINQNINNIENIANNTSIKQPCYTPICTIDKTEELVRTKTDGTKVKETKIERLFKNCIASSYKEVNGIKETVYTCPANNTTEKIIAQDNGDICTCNNKHEQAANLQKVLIATSMADAIRNSACGKNDEKDNETLNNMIDRRKECNGKTGEEYKQCMNK